MDQPPALESNSTISKASAADTFVVTGHNQANSIATAIAAATNLVLRTRASGQSAPARAEQTGNLPHSL
jgi:hypothetical protein